MKRIPFFLLTLLCIPLLCGCHSMRKPGFPRQSYDEKKQIKELEAVFEKPDLIKKYYSLTNAGEAELKPLRNEIVTGRIALINLNYNQFISQFSVTKQSLDAGADLTELGLNLATTAVGGATTKTILGAVSSGVTGTKLAIDKNFFFEKTVPVLITSMNAQRKEALLPILQGIGKSTDEYPLAQALSDLDNYYFAGTFVGALQAIQVDAGAKERQAENNIQLLRGQDWTTTDVQVRINALLDSIDKLPDVAAIELAKNPPVKDEQILKLAVLRDPTGQRLTNGAAAKQILKFEATLGGKRSAEELSAWEKAIKSTQ